MGRLMKKAKQAFSTAKQKVAKGAKSLQVRLVGGAPVPTGDSTSPGRVTRSVARSRGEQGELATPPYEEVYGAVSVVMATILTLTSRLLTPLASGRPFVHLQGNFMAACDALVEKAKHVRGCVCAGVPAHVAEDYLAGFRRVVRTGRQLAGRLEANVQQELLAALGTVGARSRELLACFIASARDSRNPQKRRALNDALKATSDAIRGLPAYCNNTAIEDPWQEAFDRAIGQLTELEPGLETEQPRDRGWTYPECLRFLDDFSQSVGATLAALQRHTAGGKLTLFCNSIAEVVTGFTRLAEYASQAAFLAVDGTASGGGMSARVTSIVTSIRDACGSLESVVVTQKVVQDAERRIESGLKRLFRATRVGSIADSEAFEDLMMLLEDKLDLLGKATQAFQDDLTGFNQELCSDAARPFLEALDNVAAFLRMEDRRESSGIAGDSILALALRMVKETVELLRTMKGLEGRDQRPDFGAWQVAAAVSSRHKATFLQLVKVMRENAAGCRQRRASKRRASPQESTSGCSSAKTSRRTDSASEPSTSWASGSRSSRYTEPPSSAPSTSAGIPSSSASTEPEEQWLRQLRGPTTQLHHQQVAMRRGSSTSRSSTGTPQRSARKRPSTETPGSSSSKRLRRPLSFSEAGTSSDQSLDIARGRDSDLFMDSFGAAPGASAWVDAPRIADDMEMPGPMGEDDQAAAEVAAEDPAVGEENEEHHPAQKDGQQDQVEGNVEGAADAVVDDGEEHPAEENGQEDQAEAQGAADALVVGGDDKHLAGEDGQEEQAEGDAQGAVEAAPAAGGGQGSTGAQRLRAWRRCRRYRRTEAEMLVDDLMYSRWYRRYYPEADAVLEECLRNLQAGRYMR